MKRNWLRKTAASFLALALFAGGTAFRTDAEQISSILLHANAEDPVLQLGENLFTIQQNTTSWSGTAEYSFTPEESGYYCFNADCLDESHAWDVIYSVKGCEDYCEVYEKYPGYIIYCKLDAGKTYTFFLEDPLKEEKAVDYSVNIERMEKHNITIVNDFKHGTIIPSLIYQEITTEDSAYSGTIVQFEILAEKGYAVDHWIITDTEGHEYEANNKWNASFYMPNCDVTVTAAMCESTVDLDDEGTLHLWPGFNVNHMRYYLNSRDASSVRRIVAEDGVILPEDANYYFAFFFKVKAIDLSHADTSQVKDMSCMFAGDSALEEIVLSGIDTSQVDDMSGMFWKCSSLTALDLSSMDTSRVEDMSCMFINCKSLKSLDLSHFDTSHVEYMEEMFYKCSDLETLDLSGFRTDRLTDTIRMFADCEDLKTICVGDNWTTEAVEADEDMFRNCTALSGGLGTAFDEAHVDAEYARIDGKGDQPGYLTAKPADIINPPVQEPTGSTETDTQPTETTTKLTTEPATATTTASQTNGTQATDESTAEPTAETTVQTTASKEAMTTETVTSTSVITSTDPANTETTEMRRDGWYASLYQFDRMARKDYLSKHPNAEIFTRTESVKDDIIRITITDKDGSTLDVYTLDAKTGIGTDQQNGAVDLPQTGITSTDTALGIAGAWTLLMAGLWLTARSAGRKDDDE